MVKVVATTRGYFGGVVREVGDCFDIADDVMKERRPSWVKIAKTSTAAAPEPDAVDPAGPVVVPADWRNQSAAERKALAKALTGEAVSTAKAADEIIEAHADAAAPEPFSDAPAPQTVGPVRASNEINDALGSTQPDWVAPPISGPMPVAE